MAASAADLGTIATARGTITSSELSQHVQALASDAFEGREGGTRGGRASGAYLLDAIRRLEYISEATQGDLTQEFGNGYRNILVLLPGSDPEASKEVIVVGGHYDHVGYGTWQNSQGPIGYIHNGADDNASGVAALLEVLEAFDSMKAAPRRTVLFAFWDAEEKGLLGSKHWLNYPTISVDRVQFTINSDMLGRLRNEELILNGVRTAAGLRELCSRQNATTGLNLKFDWDLIPDSDHYPFLERRVPLIMLHTGKHYDYHRPSDDADKVNMEGLETVSRFLFQLVFETAQRPELPAFRAASRQENEAARENLLRPLAQPAPRLGISWDSELSKQGIIQVGNVVTGSAADQGGIQTGDRILSMGRVPAEKIADLRTLVLVLENPVPVQVQRDGNPDPIDLELNLPGNPIRVGVSWRTDDVEPNCVILNRVIKNSPADVGGLQLGDRIYEVSGNAVTSSEKFMSLISDLPSPLQFVVERKGRIDNVDVDLSAAVRND